jgi:hypothetical protein
MSDSLTLETDAEVADIVCSSFGSRELRRLASNAGVSRTRGDTMRKTAERIVTQDPALAARLAEANAALPCDCGPFRERREVGEERISLPEAINRARSRKMGYRLKRLRNAMKAAPHYDLEVNWEYGGKVTEDGYEPGMTSMVATTEADMHPLLRERAHGLLGPRGRIWLAEAGGVDYAEKDHKARSQWDLFCGRIERFYEP